MPSFAGSEGEVHYEQWDPAEGPQRIVLIVHGYAEYGARYNHLARVLAEQGALVCAEDHLGHGRSDGERALINDFEHVVDDLRTLLDVVLEEHPGLPVVLVGHSMGGLLAARFAQRSREQVAGIAFLGAVIGDWKWARNALAQPELPEAATDFSGMSRDPVAVEAYAHDPLIYHGRYQRSLLEAEVIALDRFAEQIDQLTMPVLFCHGTEDPFVDYRTSLAAVEEMPSTDRTIRLYDGARHELVNEVNRDEVIAEIAAFIVRVT